MTYIHLKDRVYYEERYDRLTVRLCRDQEDILRKVYKKAHEGGLPKLTGEDKDKDPEVELNKAMGLFHYFMVDTLAGERWQERTEQIEKWMAEDEAKDMQVREARLTKEPVCHHCGKTGLRIISKDLMSRDSDYEHELVLFMLQCTHCKERSAIWEDGLKFEVSKETCPKCGAEMEDSSSRRGKVITHTYSCPACKHTYKSTLDLRPKKEAPDPYWDEDKARFVLTDEQGEKYLESKRNLEGLKKLVDEMKEREVNKEVYDAVAAMNKVNIGQLNDVLQPAIEKAGYTELSFDKPEMGKDVFVGFNCLDGKMDRQEYESQKKLKKVVTKALETTNWRLMSDGISYRLGYLNGRLRAFEREDDLVELVKKNKKALAKSTAKTPNTIKDGHGNDIIL